MIEKFNVVMQDSEASAKDNALRTVSVLAVGKAFNSLCKMMGGRWPDAKMEKEAPEAYTFFMSLLDESTSSEQCPMCESKDVMHMTHCNFCESDYATGEQVNANAAIRRNVNQDEPIQPLELEGIKSAIHQIGLVILEFESTEKTQSAIRELRAAIKHKNKRRDHPYLFNNTTCPSNNEMVRLRNRIAELEEFKEKAFLAHPNLDIDIEFVEQMRQNNLK